MTLILSASTTFEQKKDFQTQKTKRQNCNGQFLQRITISRPFRFLLCSEIIVQLMVICKKKEFFHSILHTILLCTMLFIVLNSNGNSQMILVTMLYAARCTIITETKQNWWKNMSWPAFAIAMARQGTIMIPYAFHTRTHTLYCNRFHNLMHSKAALHPFWSDRSC